jgi:hypothetical protein
MTHGQVRWLPASSTGYLPACAGEFPAVTRPPSPSVRPTRNQRLGGRSMSGPAGSARRDGPSLPRRCGQADASAPTLTRRLFAPASEVVGLSVAELAPVTNGLVCGPWTERRTRLHRLLPGVLVDAGRGPWRWTCCGGHAVLGKALGERSVAGRRRVRGCGGTGRTGLRAARRERNRHGDGRGKGEWSH